MDEKLLSAVMPLIKVYNKRLSKERGRGLSVGAGQAMTNESACVGVFLQNLAMLHESNRQLDDNSFHIFILLLFLCTFLKNTDLDTY